MLDQLKNTCYIKVLCILFFPLGPVYHEYCACPEEDPEVWLETLSCPTKESQISNDFAPFPSIDLKRMLEEVPRRFAEQRGAIVHYTILDNQIYRRSLGKYTDFKMFSDEMLQSLARKVPVYQDSFQYQIICSFSPSCEQGLAGYF